MHLGNELPQKPLNFEEVQYILRTVKDIRIISKDLSLGDFILLLPSEKSFWYATITLRSSKLCYCEQHHITLMWSFTFMENNIFSRYKKGSPGFPIQRYYIFKTISVECRLFEKCQTWINWNHCSFIFYPFQSTFAWHFFWLYSQIVHTALSLDNSEMVGL